MNRTSFALGVLALAFAVAMPAQAQSPQPSKTKPQEFSCGGTRGDLTESRADREREFQRRGCADQLRSCGPPAGWPGHIPGRCN